MQVLLLLIISFLICGKVQTRLTRVLAAICFSCFLLTEFICFFITGDYLNTNSLSHLDSDVLFSTFWAFRWHWAAVFLLFAALCGVFSFAARKVVKNIRIMDSRKVFMIAMFALAAPLCVAGGVVHNIYLIVKLKNLPKATFSEILDSLGNTPSGYVKLENLTVSASNPKNIILITLESFEKAYTDRTDLTPHLNQIARKWHYYSNYSTANRTSPTIAAVYSLLTGLPFEFSGESMNAVFDYRTLNPEFVSLPAVLKRAGYVLEYVASIPDFAGTSNLLRSMGFDHIKGYSSDISSDSPKSSMGLFDKDIFSLAKSEHERLIQENKPFFMHIATVGTHFPMDRVGNDPRIPEHLKSISKNTQECIIRWTDVLVGDFIEYLTDSGAMDNTLVVIVPDHIGRQQLLPDPDADPEKRGLFLLASASPGDVEEPLTHYDMPKFILTAAGLETNARFFNDFFLKNIREPFLSKEITNNLSKIAMLNASIVESSRKDIKITRNENSGEFTFDFGKKRASIAINDSRSVIIAPLSQYGDQSAANVFANYLQNAKDYLLENPCLIVVPEEENFKVVLNPLSVFSKVYEARDNHITVPIADVQEAYAWKRRFPTGPLAAVPQYNYGFQQPESTVVLSLVSTNSAGSEIYKPGVSLRGPLAAIGMGLGLTIVTAKPTGIAYTTFDVGAGDEPSLFFLTELREATKSGYFFAVVARGNLWGFPEKFADDLRILGFPILAIAPSDEPYIAYRKDDGKIVELRPGMDELQPPSLNAFTASIGFSKKEISPNLVYYDSTLYARIKEKERLGYRSFLYNRDRDIANSKAYIAHAGGAVDGNAYTNSLEAVHQAIEKGFTFIELDLLQTTDGHIVAAHDWATFNRITGHPEDGDAPLTLNEFMSRRIHSAYTPLSETDICKIISENPEVVLITDKISNYPALVDAFPFVDRLIVEVFSPQDYLGALDAGIHYPAYGMHGAREVNLAGAFGFKLTTASGAAWGEQSEALKFLHNQGVAIMLYGAGRPVNARFDTEEFFRENLGVVMSMYYSDFWNPSKGERQ